MDVPVPLLLHGDLEAAVEDLVESADPVLHLSLAVGSQQVRALVLHLQLKGKAPHLVILQTDTQRGRKLGETITVYVALEWKVLRDSNSLIREQGSTTNTEGRALH